MTCAVTVSNPIRRVRPCDDAPDINLTVAPSAGMNPSYANPQGMEPSFDISHERIKGEHNREQKHSKSRKKTTTQSAWPASTTSSDKHFAVASIMQA